MKPLYRMLLMLFTVICSVSPAVSQRAIPEDNLGYPVLISVNQTPAPASTSASNGPVTVGNGSGFFLNNGKFIFLVTARHVLFDPATMKLRGDNVTLIAYSRNASDTGRNRITLDLTALNAGENIRPHRSEDVAVIRLAIVSDAATEGAPPLPPPTIPTPTATPVVPPATANQIQLLLGVTLNEQMAAGLVGVNTHTTVSTFDKVLVGNDVVMFGYPTSLALVPNAKIDFSRPLLRRGIVAGENVTQRSIILDCPSYQGDSGSPIIEVDYPTPFQRTFSIIGVMSEYVPFADALKSEHFGYSNYTVQNSGYSVITPMDFVLELLD